MFFAAILLARGAWVWWNPPVTVRPDARHGLSLRQIARLSPEAWTRVASRDRDDEAQDAYGVALRADSRRIGAQTEPLRRAAFLYGMACIAVEDTLAGGGTWSIHAPHEMFASSERMIHELVLNKGRPSVGRERIEGVVRTFRHCLTMKAAPERLLGGKVDLAKLRRYARLALRYESELRRRSITYPPALRANVDRFVIDWGQDYLAVRGASKLAGEKREQARALPKIPVESNAPGRDRVYL